MLSLKSFLNASESELALRKVVSLLIEKIGSSAAKADGGQQAADFALEMNDLRDRLATETSSENLLIMAGSVVQTIENYNAGVSTLIRKQAAELQSVIAMVTETALKIGGESTRSAQRLQEIGNHFEKAGSFDDLKTLKAHLGECLNSFREEVDRQKRESDSAIRSLQRQVGQTAEISVGSNETPDPITGLPCKPSALQAMQAAAESGMRLYVVAMVVKGVQSVNTRFGLEVGDRMLRTFKDNLERHVSPKDKLFRWEGPAIVALMDRPEPVGQVRTQIRRILDGRLEQNFTVDGRSVLIPIHADFLIFQLMPPMAQAVRQIQKFVGGQAPVNTAA